MHDIFEAEQEIWGAAAGEAKKQPKPADARKRAGEKQCLALATNGSLVAVGGVDLLNLFEIYAKSDDQISEMKAKSRKRAGGGVEPKNKGSSSPQKKPGTSDVIL